MSVSIEADLYDFTRDSIRNWVGKNFGSKELEEPSWNIDELASYLTRRLNKREQTINQLTEFGLVICLKEMPDEERAKIMNRVFEKLDRVGGSLKTISYDRDSLTEPIQGERKIIRVKIKMEVPTNNRAVRGLDRWLERQRDGHGTILKYDLIPSGFGNIFC